jgi:hypothetical protein
VVAGGYGLVLCDEVAVEIGLDGEVECHFKSHLSAYHSTTVLLLHGRLMDGIRKEGEERGEQHTIIKETHTAQNILFFINPKGINGCGAYSFLASQREQNQTNNP